MGITTREFGPYAKGSRLTTAEMDENFNYLNSKPYKVYTALLTQSGGDNQQTITSGTLTKGVTYRIESNDGDYSNVGAPNNNDYTYFVATIDAEPTTWGSFGLSYNTGAPVVTVLENTIGNIYFTYYGTGDYLANLLNGFPYDKTTVFMQGQNFIQVANNLDYIEIVTNSVDNQLGYTPIEIRVYN